MKTLKKNRNSRLRFILMTALLIPLIQQSHVWAASDRPPAGKILLMKGQVFIVDATAKVVADPEGKRGRSTQAGSPFFVGETIQTKSDGRVKLQFVEGQNEAVLGADTALVIERASTSADKRGTTLNLARGEVRSEVKQKYSGQGDDVYEIKAKNAVAGVRGTSFLLSIDKVSGNVSAYLGHGGLVLRTTTSSANGGRSTASSNSVTLKPGEYSSVSPSTNKPMTPTRNVPPNIAASMATLGGSPAPASSSSSSSSSPTGGASNSNGNSSSAPAANGGTPSAPTSTSANSGGSSTSASSSSNSSSNNSSTNSSSNTSSAPSSAPAPAVAPAAPANSAASALSYAPMEAEPSATTSTSASSDSGAGAAEASRAPASTTANAAGSMGVAGESTNAPVASPLVSPTTPTNPAATAAATVNTVLTNVATTTKSAATNNTTPAKPTTGTATVVITHQRP